MITTKGRYAIRFMIDLAEQPSGTIVPLDETASRQEISKKYLEIVVKMLVKAKLVKGTSGKGGGYTLLRDPKNYSVAEILLATEGSLAPVACLDACSEPCQRESVCKTLPMWKQYARMVHDYFSGITIEDLVNGYGDDLSE